MFGRKRRAQRPVRKATWRERLSDRLLEANERMAKKERKAGKKAKKKAKA